MNFEYEFENPQITQLKELLKPAIQIRRLERRQLNVTFRRCFDANVQAIFG